MNRLAVAAGAVVLVIITTVLGLPILAVVVVSGSQAEAAAVCTNVSPAPSASLSSEQMGNAAIIVAVVQERQLPERAAVIAVATAWQESSLINLAHGDVAGPDSRGLFQQRLSIYTDIDPMDPRQATGAFLDRLVGVPNWQTRPLADVAWDVQRFRDDAEHRRLYTEKEAGAMRVVTELWPEAANLAAGCTGAGATGPLAGSGYGSVLDTRWYEQHPDWFTKPHHDYPAADIPVPPNTPVYAARGGRVVTSPTGGDCGQGLVIDGDDGFRYIYCHGTQPVAPEGATVAAGQLVMYSGWTGHVIPAGPEGAHLHFAIRDSSGVSRCPQLAIEAWAQGRAVDMNRLPTSGCTY
jgi:murein DD-endopeptidase MepM/ murein hydrolase activator NlpD